MCVCVVWFVWLLKWLYTDSWDECMKTSGNLCMLIVLFTSMFVMDECKYVNTRVCLHKCLSVCLCVCVCGTGYLRLVFWLSMATREPFGLGLLEKTGGEDAT